jgi:hypothetical protein
LWVKPVIIKRKYRVVYPEIIPNHPGRKNQEGDEQENYTLSSRLKKTVLFALGVSRIYKGNKKDQQEKGDQAVVFSAHGQPTKNG